MSSLSAIPDINGVKPGLYLSPYFIFRNTDIKTVRYGGMELYSTDINRDYPDLLKQRRVLEINQEYGRKIAYLEY